MNLEARIGWLYGLGAMVLFTFNPFTGILCIFIGILILILWCFDINVKQRVKYYKEPKRLYNIGSNIKGADKIHDLQLKGIPYMLKGMFAVVKGFAAIPMILSIGIGSLLIIYSIKLMR